MKKPVYYCPFLLFALIILVTTALSGVDTANAEQNLDQQIQRRNLEKQRLTHERQETLTQITRTENRTVRVVEILSILGENIKRSQRKLRQLKQDIFYLKKQIIRSSQKIGQLKIEIEKDKKEINQQILALYYLGKVREMTLFIGLNSFEHYFRNQKLLQNSTELDIKLLNRLNRHLTLLNDERSKLNSQRLSLDSLKTKEEALSKLLVFEKEQQVTYLNHLRTDRATHVRYLREIQVELEQLNDKLYSLATQKENRKKTLKFKGFYSQKYRLPSPVKGKIVHGFGQKQSPFYTLFRRGVLVETVSEAEVQSILGGKVVWAGPFRGYQNLVILDHGKGSLSVYGNLEEIFVLVDDVIEQGYVLGSVSLDRVEERTLFYFEMRVNKRAINPARWLKKPRWK
jgi:murein hydrolase activator